MSATTKLQFTLTSPGTDPDPTPDNPSYTPSTPSGTTYVTPGSPNTGDNTAGDAGSGTVFAALFAVIGFAALAIFLVRYLKKNRHLSFAERGSFHISARPRVFATVALTLAVAFIGGITITNMYNSARNTEAASQRELPVSVASSITFDVDRGQSSIKSDTIKVENNGAKYDLYISTTNNKFARDASTYLSPVSASITSPNSAIEEDQWGMTTQPNIVNPAVGGQIWAAAPTTETKIQSDVTASTTPAYYAVNLGSDLPDGTYSTEVTYRAIAKNYKVTVDNGFVNKEGDKTVDYFDSGVDVMIRESCTASSKTFDYWYVYEGLDSASVIAKVQDILYRFTMPAKDVHVKAICKGDPDSDPQTKWEIHYDKNATNATGDMPAQVVTSEPATLDANKFIYTGYTFQGWACSKTATVKDFDNSQGNITKSVLEGKGCTKTPGSSETSPATNDYYTLYAIWKKDTTPEPQYIQDVTPEMCDEMSLFEIKTLPDRRVETGAEKAGYTYITDSLGKHVQYSYTKFADGRCWMLQDLAYHPTGATTLTVADTDVSEQRTVTFSVPTGAAGSGALYYTQSGYSTLYNYEAATGGYWSRWSSKAANKVVPDSLCPASWKIPDASHSPTDPSYGTNSGEFYNVWDYNIGQKNGGGTSFSVPNKRNFIFKESITTSSGTFTALHFKYNGSRDFGNNTWADDGGDATKGKAGNYASYFLSTTTTKNSEPAPAAYNPHAPGVEEGDPDIDGIGVTTAAHGSAVRCLLRTKDQRVDMGGNRATPGGNYGDASVND
ncbi:MAG: hypothetical protein Q4A25_00495 [Candidatus Saccharibacteria bacterium]|nr:hypothetical protein [Candidatus Saccharibacteria bacterium]